MFPVTSAMGLVIYRSVGQRSNWSNEASALAGLCAADVLSLSLSELVASADDALFQRILYNPNHVLHSLLTDLNATGHCLKHRRHDTFTSKDWKKFAD